MHIKSQGYLKRPLCIRQHSLHTHTYVVAVWFVERLCVERNSSNWEILLRLRWRARVPANCGAHHKNQSARTLNSWVGDGMHMYICMYVYVYMHKQYALKCGWDAVYVTVTCALPGRRGRRSCSALLAFSLSISRKGNGAPRQGTAGVAGCAGARRGALLSCGIF